jgi:multidrug efflux pump subunit AcrB
MWIVSVALRRPYTFIVLALLITLLGVFTILRTPTDIFPNIKIPVVATVWRYSGLSPDEMATRLVLGSERGATTGVNDVEHSESVSLSGIGIVKFFFQPNASEELSYAQITASSQTGLNFAPPGTTPPYVLAFNASTVPVIQLALSSGPRRRSSTWVKTCCAPRSPRYRERRSRGRTAACNGRYRSTSIRRRFARAACPATM